MQSCYVKATDGVKLAVDVMLPKDKPSNAPLPCVLFQARYAKAQCQDMLAMCMHGCATLCGCPWNFCTLQLSVLEHLIHDRSTCRYTRGVQLRFPFRLMTDGRPYDFINIGFKAEALLEGYAVISMDFRGTGEQSRQGQSSLIY